VLRLFKVRGFCKQTGDPVNQMKKRSRLWTIVLALRVTVALGWSFLIALNFRGHYFGFGLGSLGWVMGTVLFYGVPVSCLAFLGVRVRAFFLGVALVTGTAIAGAEVVAGLEEALFKNEVEGTTEHTVRGRWWPFRSNHIGYSSDGVWFAGC